MPQKPKALLVDDSKFFLKAAASVLESQGFQVVTAATGEDALRCAQAEKPNIIFLDMMLPRLDGMMVLRMLHANPATRSTPVIVLSGNKMSYDIEQAKALGVVDYCIKDATPLETLAQRAKQQLAANSN